MANPTSSVITAIRVSGTDYKVDYESLGNRPNLTVESATKDSFGGDLDIQGGTLTLGSTSITEQQLGDLLSGGGGGNTAFADFLTMSASSLSDPNVSVIGPKAFKNYKTLQYVAFPSCTTIGEYAFENVSGLQDAVFPACVSIGSRAFCGTSEAMDLTYCSFPACQTIETSAFYNCPNVSVYWFPVASYIGAFAFLSHDINTFVSYYFLSNSVPVLGASYYSVFDAFESHDPTTPCGAIYVRASLHSDFIAPGSGWEFLSDYIRDYNEE